MATQEMLAKRELEIETGYLLGNKTKPSEAADRFPIKTGESRSGWTVEYQEREYVGSVRRLPTGLTVYTKGPRIIYLPDGTAHVQYKVPLIPGSTIEGICAQTEYQSTQFDPSNQNEKREAVEWGLLQIDADPNLKIYSMRMGRLRHEKKLYFPDGTFKELAEDTGKKADRAIDRQKNNTETLPIGINFKFDIDDCVITKGQANSAYNEFEGHRFTPIELEAILKEEDTSNLAPVYNSLAAARDVTQRRFKKVKVDIKPGLPKKSRWLGPKTEHEVIRQLHEYYTEKRKSSPPYTPVVVYQSSNRTDAPENIIFAM